MKIEKIPVGYLQANCYILNVNNDNIIIDPGDNFELIKSKIVGNVSAVLITHHHEDHIGALPSLREFYHCPLYDFYSLTEKKYFIGPFSFEVIYTPGHTDDSITYYFYKDKIMFTGDFLFKGTIGRTDLDTGDMDKMLNSLRKISLFSDVMIYPGHGDITSLNDEKRTNIFFKG